jgi:hypothetical protein
MTKLTALWKRIPTTMRHGIGEAVALWVVTFGALVAQLGTHGLSTGAIAASAVAAARLVFARFLPGFPDILPAEPVKKAPAKKAMPTE